MTEHTSGPWWYDGINYIWGPHNEMIADIPDECRVARIRGVGAKLPIDSNAYVLAAAPKMLKVLEALVESNVLELATSELVELVKESIADARGENECQKF